MEGSSKWINLNTTKTKKTNILSDHSEIKLEINNSRKAQNPQNTWTLKNELLTVVGHPRNKTGNFHILKDKQKLKETYQKVWDTAKAAQRWTFIVIGVHIKKDSESHCQDKVSPVPGHGFTKLLGFPHYTGPALLGLTAVATLPLLSALLLHRRRSRDQVSPY